MICTQPGRALVGHAATARIAALAPSTKAPEVLKARRMAYCRAMHDAPKPSVAVIRDLDDPDCTSADWGKINMTSTRASACRAR